MNEALFEELIPTRDEQRTINALKKLAARWPKTIKLFYGDGTLSVMRVQSDGNFFLRADDCLNSDYSIATIDIPGDGGGF